jgi:TetR/AcrR family transcriptional regulator, regulator of cefoperazone and chloramphenicol sensitivity
MVHRPANAQSKETHQRLLDAAGEVFAKRGYHGATIREICRCAGANLAAVNYHFKDKQHLYDAVLRYAHRHALEKYPADPKLHKDTPPEQRLAAFVGFFLRKILDEGRPAWHGKLLVREMNEPTEALDKLVEEEIRPRHEHIEAVVRELLSPDAPAHQVDLCVWSILGQCLFYQHSRPVIVRLHPEYRYSPDEITHLAEHITRFTLGAIKQLAGAQQGETV